jgi:hypothetical protein
MPITIEIRVAWGDMDPYGHERVIARLSSYAIRASHLLRDPLIRSSVVVLTD